ncbi:MAG TPA: TIGR00730 family Rossman fold protein [Balneolales bacterium]|nr:TIGR00730 family Rossman fold protein [Balneolales bacterium]
MSKISRICVFCGSSSGANGHYKDAAIALGNKMIEHHIDLVYGGSSIGLMGTVADTILKQNGKVIGVIPEVLTKPEVAHHHLSEQHVVKTMHERKALMSDLSDAFLVLPGGFGTLDETFEIITWSQLGIHNKPIGILNIDDYFEPLFDFIVHAHKNGFIREKNMKLFFQAKSIDECFTKMYQVEERAENGQKISKENI